MEAENIGPRNNDNDPGQQEDVLNDDNDQQVFPDNTFDMTLATMHSYLGNDLQVLRGRTLLDNGIYVNLPLYYPMEMVLFPGQTLPITEVNYQAIQMLQQCISKDRTFGVTCDSIETNIGTTAEIYEYSINPEQNIIRGKARGRQRFKILRVKNSSGSSCPVADVQILPEIELGPPFYQHRLNSLDRLRIFPTDEESVKRQDKVTRRESALTPWPAWVYHQYDARRLSMKIRNQLSFVEYRGSNIPNDPIELSFWVAYNLVVSTQIMMLLLKMDCAISRLQMEVKLLEKLSEKIYICKRCRSPITRQTDVLPMNQEGLQSAYCNLYGTIHETITFYRAQFLDLKSSLPTTEYSWFPGYAWTIAYCGSCDAHMGWRFTATRSDLRPQSFWGLKRNSLECGIRKSNEENEFDVFTDSGNMSFIS